METLNKSYQNLLEEVSLYLQALGYQTSSQSSITSGVKAFLLWLEKESINALNLVERSTINHYQAYLENRPNERRTGGLSSKMIRDYLSSVGLLFKYLERQGKLSINPMSGYVLPKVESEKRQILSVLEVEQLYGVCKSLKERCVLHLYYGMGLRRSEGAALNLKDVDYRKGWLTVVKGKGGKGRSLPMSNQIQADLKGYVLEERGFSKSEALLLNRINKRLSGNSSLLILRKLLKRAQLNAQIDLHSLRHSIATHLVQSGMELEQVRQYLGHAHLESTQRYLHYDNRKLFTAQLSSGKCGDV